MIGKSLVLICAVIGLAAGACVELSGCASPVISTGCVGASVSPVVTGTGLYGAGLLGGNVYGAGVYGAGVYGAGVYGAGVYGNNLLSGAVVASNGPETAPLPVVQAPSVTLPTVEAPVVALPSAPVPAPRVIAQRCICTKTVVKPQVIQRQVTVPKVQRYIKRTVTPIVENVQYKSRPVPQCGCASSVASAPVVGTGACAYNSGSCYSRVC